MYSNYCILFLLFVSLSVSSKTNKTQEKKIHQRVCELCQRNVTIDEVFYDITNRYSTATRQKVIKLFEICKKNRCVAPQLVGNMVLKTDRVHSFTGGSDLYFDPDGVVSSAVPVSILDTTDSTHSSTGALIVAGGIGVAKDVYINGDVHANQFISSTNPYVISKWAGMSIISATGIGEKSLFTSVARGSRSFDTSDLVNGNAITIIMSGTYVTSTPNPTLTFRLYLTDSSFMIWERAVLMPADISSASAWRLEINLNVITATIVGSSQLILDLGTAFEPTQTLSFSQRDITGLTYPAELIFTVEWAEPSLFNTITAYQAFILLQK